MIKRTTKTNNKKFRLCGESNVIECRGFVMKGTKPSGPSEIDQSLEKDIAGNIRALPRISGGRPENGAGETSGDNLGTLLRRVSEASTCEIESLIDELHGLRKKLETHGARIQSDIVRYTELSQGVMQLTTIISDNVKRLSPAVPDVGR